jgi:hypothetical protein
MHNMNNLKFEHAYIGKWIPGKFILHFYELYCIYYGVCNFKTISG